MKKAAFIISKIYSILSFIGAGFLIVAGVFLLIFSTSSTDIMEELFAEYSVNVPNSIPIEVLYYTFVIVILIVGVYLVGTGVVATIATKKIEKAQNKKELMGIAIANIIFSNVVGGIFMLVVRDTEFQA